MNARQHTNEAEWLIGQDAIPEHITGEDYDRRRADDLAEAQVHATLAVAKYLARIDAGRAR